ncbi:unnamed protein product [Sphagnum compactum]
MIIIPALSVIDRSIYCVAVAAEKAFVEMEQRLLEQTAKISDVDAQRKSLLAVENKLEKDLDCARTQIRELQEQIHMEAEQSAAELMKLKQKISVLEAKEDESIKRESLLEKKLQSLRDLEIEVVELRRTNKELQHHKRELNIKLNEVTSQPTHSSNVNQVLFETAKIAPAKVETRAKRIPKPPPRPSGLAPGKKQVSGKTGGMLPPPPPPPQSRSPPGAPSPPPPPPPPPLGSLKVQEQNKAKMQRVPEVVQFYQSLMKRAARKESLSATSGAAKNPEARSNMIGEIANRSTHLLAIKADVETQKEFVEALATEVRSAAFTNMEDVVAFVRWLDEELSFLVDERAVLKHFDWPEGKADALREAAFEYQDLEKLQQKVAVFEDKSELPCEVALSRMLAAQEKMEKSVYTLLRGRDMTTTRYKEYDIPTQWMLDSGLVGQIKLGAVRIARLYMKRAASELDLLSATSEKEPLLEFLLLQGVQFAFRVHQFAGGFDAESMAAFEALRNRAHLGNNPKT